MCVSVCVCVCVCWCVNLVNLFLVAWTLDRISGSFESIKGLFKLIQAAIAQQGT